MLEAKPLDVEKVRADFPILKRTVNGKRLVYLDNAATSQKPLQVINALVDYYSKHNANIHRSVHTLSEEATEAYEEARKKTARFVGASTKELVFTRGTTEATNLVRFAWGERSVKRGDTLVTTLMEHHSNIVPWQLLAKQKGAVLKFVGLHDDGTLDMESFEKVLKDSPALVAVTHCSNVLGTINDVREICIKAKNAGAVTLVDAAQSVPHMPVDVSAIGSDFFAFSVVGETPVLVDDEEGRRLMPIEDAVGAYERDRRISVLTLDQRGSVSFQPITNTLTHADDVFGIRYENSGLELFATAHHSVYVWRNGDIHEAKVVDLKKGDYLITFNAQDKRHSSKEQTFQFTYTQYGYAITETVPLTRELVRLVGYYLAEGCVDPNDYKVSLAFSEAEDEYVADAVSIARRLEPIRYYVDAAEQLKQTAGLSVTEMAETVGVTQKTVSKYLSSTERVGLARGRQIAVRVDHNRSSHTSNVCFNSRKWCEFFANLCGTGATNKHLPPFAWSLDSRLVYELLDGYLRGDASKNEKHRLVTKTVSKRLASEFSWLLKLHGISNSLGFSRSRNPKWHDTFTLVIQRSSLRNLKEFSRVNLKKDSPRDAQLCVDGLRDAYKLAKAKYDYRVSSLIRSRVKRTTRDGVMKVVDWIRSTHSVPLTVEVEQILDRYIELADGDIGLVKVRSVVPAGKRPVFDVSVANSERFFGGHYPVLLHNSGHKMLGPTGIGALVGKRSLLEDMDPFQGGGEMIREVFLDHSTWNDVPLKFEAGTVNIADSIGLGAAVDYLSSLGMEKVRGHELGLTKYTLDALSRVKGLRLYGPSVPQRRVGVFSFNLADIPSHDLATILDEEGIAIRSGHNCAQPLMRWLNITATGRASFYIYNAFDDVDALVAGLEKARRIFRA
jgi:selenocysteine lyase/cysteine desulfurase/intein/homing endonuclease